ncbi:MAG: bifunctional cytidylyltransferase/SDR family oxidoreductase [Bifidobacteriaceae bacterium]|nr:bifunctional cytidylyltransferase/SDR family oxidoreductase [Bifidobacteriaceae bacterium]
MKTYGVILAGGVGARLGLSVPKQMIKVAGKTILEHTVAAFDSHPLIDEVIVMITPGWTERVATLLGSRFAKLSLILEGGVTRNETTRRVLEAIDAEEAKLLLHDAVRPLVSERIISECVHALDRHEAVDVAIPSSDTVVMVDEDEVITRIPDRSRLRRGQTPQAFKLSTLRAAYARAIEDPYFHATDDCGVVVRYLPQVEVKCVLGSEDNIKVTHPVDLTIADKLFQLATQVAPHKSLTELTAALAGKTIVVLGGSYGIGAEIARIAKAAGAAVVAHGRSTTGLHVQDLAAIEAAFDAAAAEHGGVDAVVLTAGVLKIGPLAAASPEDIEQSIAVNYTAAVNVARAAHSHLAASRGHLLLFTSSAYTRGRENYALYSSSKAAVVNLAQALAEEWAGDGIKVNVVNPERTETPMRLNAFGAEPAGSLLSAERVAEASLDAITSDLTGMVLEVRRSDA